MALNKIKKDSITADAVDATKIADDAISDEHLDPTAISGQTELSATADGSDVLLVFDTSASTIKKIQVSNVNSAPTLTSISPTNANTGDGTGNHTFTITGTNFDSSATAFFINASGTEVNFDSVTRNSATQLTGVIAKSSLPNSGEPYDIVALNSNGQQAKKRAQVNINAQPAFNTSAGTLGTKTGGASVGRIIIDADDPESSGVVTYELQSGSLPAGLSLTNETSEGGIGVISGTATNPVANTTSNFVIRAVDASSNTSSRAFSITVNRVFTSTSFTSSGTFAVPSGVSSLDSVLVVAGGAAAGNDHGGGGGAGGLVFMPAYPVTPGGTITVTVGNGASGNPNTRGPNGVDSVFGAPGDPGKHPSGDVLTAKGGGGGGGGNSCVDGAAGGSGGGGSGHGTNPVPSSNSGGAATQPTQPGDSGAYGFGNVGGIGQRTGPGSLFSGGGGGAGGAGAVGGQGQCGIGGQGKQYTIADGTTSVYYAGGGGGSHYNNSFTSRGGGQGGGGNSGDNSQPAGQAGQANKGGGGGGNGGDGGKGIVIVRF
tara:strand:+ start:1948 stop:3576 length:1629 start_codon:yes stop_codon:yes gene_type:complete